MPWQNTDVHSRVWPDLVDGDTHTTLSLGPGESVDNVERWTWAEDGAVTAEPLPADFNDGYLTFAKAKASKPAATPDAPAASPAPESPKE